MNLDIGDKKMKKYSVILKIMFLGFVFILYASSYLFAQENNKSLKTIKIYVQYNLAKDGLMDHNDINVRVVNKNILLDGMVKTIADKKEAAEDAEAVSSDYNVVNNLKIAPTDMLPVKIVKEVMHNIYGNTFYSVFDYVNAKYHNGVITLSGYVHLPWYKKIFQKEAEKVPGVIKINNKIKKTFGPGKLGITAARYIYSDPEFQGYAFSANPPVHIIVNNGRVLLFGNVNSEVESSMAANIIRFKTDAFNVVNNLSIHSNGRS